MEDTTSGAEKQVFSDGEPSSDWYPKEEDTAGLGDEGGKASPEKKDPEKKDPEKKDPEKKDPEKKDSEKKDEGDGPKKDPEKKDPEKKDPEKKDPEKKDPEKKDPEKKEDRETFRKILDKGQAKPIPEKRQRHKNLQEGDYTVKDDGTVVVHAQHLVDDYHAIVEDVRTFFKIYDSKTNQKKAEFIAEKLLGFESDGIRTAGKVAYDVLDAFNKAATEEEREEIVENFFPELLRDKEAIPKATFSLKESPKKEDPKKKDPTGESKSGVVTEEELARALKIWKVDSGVDVDIKKAMDDPEFRETYNGFQFDAETGKKLSVEDRVSLAAEVVYGNVELPKDKKEIPIGGNKKGEPLKDSKKDEGKKSVFTSSENEDPKKWY